MTSPFATERRGAERRSDACRGRMSNGPGKRYVRCALCGRVDFEKNEGDVCGGPAGLFEDRDGLWAFR